MFGVGPLEMLLLLVIGGVVIVLLSGSIFKGGFRFGHAKLTCPQCGNETRANLGKCQHCGQSFS